MYGGMPSRSSAHAPRLSQKGKIFRRQNFAFLGKKEPQNEKHRSIFGILV